MDVVHIFAAGDLADLLFPISSFPTMLFNQPVYNTDRRIGVTSSYCDDIVEFRPTRDKQPLPISHIAQLLLETVLPAELSLNVIPLLRLIILHFLERSK